MLFTILVYSFCILVSLFFIGVSLGTLIYTIPSSIRDMKTHLEWKEYFGVYWDIFGIIILILFDFIIFPCLVLGLWSHVIFANKNCPDKQPTKILHIEAPGFTEVKGTINHNGKIIYSESI